MTSSWLYYTTVPVLLGPAHPAGRVARQIFLRHRLRPHWFGRGWSPALAAHAERHPADLATLTDPWRVRLLCDFANAPAMHGKLMALIPCAPADEDFIRHCAPALESSYVLLPCPADDADPLAALCLHDRPIS